MIVNTSRFGEVQVDPQRVITFPSGLLGFANHTQFMLLESADDSYFLWLQSTQAPELAFVVTDPSLFVPDYKVPIRPEQMQDLGISSVDQAQVFVIVNKRGHQLTGNLQGPLVVHVTNRVGTQLVLSDRRFTTRAPLVDLNANIEAISA